MFDASATPTMSSNDNAAIEKLKLMHSLNLSLDQIVEYQLAAEMDRTFQEAVQSSQEGLLDGFQRRHLEEHLLSSFEFCEDEWCAQARSSVESGEKLFDVYRTRHQKERHDDEFDDCADPWCQHAWALVVGEDLESYAN